MTQNITIDLEDLRELVSEILEVDTDELTDTGNFMDEYDADSLRAIEILARLDKQYRIEIPQDQLPELVNLLAVRDALVRYSGNEA